MENPNQTVAIRISDKTVIIDSVDMRLFGNYKWRIDHNKSTCYLRTQIGRKDIRLHRLLMHAKPGQIIDHINGNGLDNRRCNLRFCTTSENNQGCKRKNAFSKYRGVHLDLRRNRWRARICKDYKVHNLGYFKSQRAAALAYDIAADNLYGGLSHKNFRNFVVIDLAKKWLKKSNGKIFSALIKKRTNGDFREIVARIGVSKGEKSILGLGALENPGGDRRHAPRMNNIKFDPEEKNLLPVFDMLKKEYRFIDYEGLKILTIHGETWRIF